MSERTLFVYRPRRNLHDSELDMLIPAGKMCLELGCPSLPLTCLKKSSSGTHFFVVRHYVRSGFASTDKQRNCFRSTHADRNAQTRHLQEVLNELWAILNGNF